MKQSDIQITAEIKKYGGYPSLFVNNERIPTDSYITYLAENNDFKNFCEMGFNLFSVSIFFHERIINELSKNIPFSKGLFDKEDNFKYLDDQVNEILKYNPRAYIFIRTNIELPRQWELDHPDECNDEGFGGGDKRVCFSSKVWLEDVKKEIKKFVTIVQNKPYASHIIGYQVAGAMTEEWMCFDLNGSCGKASRTRFLEEVNKGNYLDNEIEYHKYLNDVNASNIIELSSYFKELTEHRLIIGTFYGYSFYHIGYEAGHASLNKLLNSDAIDFVCSPLAYWTNRLVGEPIPFMSPVGSILAHNKLYFGEYDIRTSLTKFAFDHPSYRTPIWLGPQNEDDSINQLKYAYGKALTHQCSYWWFDMWGRWYDGPKYREFIKNSAEISKESLSLNCESIRDVAVITDEESYYELSIHNPDGYEISRNQLNTLEKAGVSFDMFLASDLNRFRDKYKCLIILQATRSENIERIIKEAKTPILIINKDNKDITTSEIRDFYKRSGINCRFDFDIVVDENNHFLSLYALNDSSVDFKNEHFIDCFKNQPVKLPLSLRKGEGILLLKL